MKPLKIIIPIASILTLLPILYVLFVPSSPSVANVYSQVWFNKEWKSAALELKDKKIDYSLPQDGVKLVGYGYKMVVHGFDKATSKLGRNDYSTDYQLSDRMILLLFNRASSNAIDTYDDKGKKLLELATGIPIKTEFDCLKANLRISLSDFSLINNEKNREVEKLLAKKAANMDLYTQAYLVANNELKGFVLKHDKGYTADIFEIRDLNSSYQISFIGDWTEQEVDAAIATIQFDGQ